MKIILLPTKPSKIGPVQRAVSLIEFQNHSPWTKFYKNVKGQSFLQTRRDHAGLTNNLNVVRTH